MSRSAEPALLEIRFDACAAALQDLRQHVRERLGVEGIGEACVEDVVLAVDEACQNVIRHCYEGRQGDIVLEIRRHEGALEIWLTDFGPPVDPERVKPRPLGELRPGGLGTHFIGELMDEWGFVDSPEGSGNRMRMLKRLP